MTFLFKTFSFKTFALFDQKKVKEEFNNKWSFIPLALILILGAPALQKNTNQIDQTMKLTYKYKYKYQPRTLFSAQGSPAKRVLSFWWLFCSKHELWTMNYINLIPTKNIVLLREALPSWRARGAQVWSIPDSSQILYQIWWVGWLTRAAQVWSAASGEKVAEGSSSVRRQPLAGGTMRRLHNSKTQNG